MSTAVARLPSSESKWTVVSGPMKGSVRLMSRSTFFIGRSPECEFVIINDPKCSRKHARVDWSTGGCEIESLNEKNLVLVNGHEVTRQTLNDGDILAIGDTELQFNFTTSPTASDIRHSQIVIVDPNGVVPLPRPSAPRSAARPRAQAVKPGNKKLPFYIVLGIVLVLVFVGTSSKHKAEVALRTEQQIQAEIDNANKLKEAAERMPMKQLDQSVNLRQAQENFVRGFRDYQRGQFERSLDSFQTCLALNPSHVLCNRYIRLAQRRFNELVQYNIVIGRKYRDQNQFKACRSSFRNVMVMVKDANSAAYREAKANYDACNTLVEGHF